jgi:hypothetical protein
MSTSGSTNPNIDPSSGSDQPQPDYRVRSYSCGIVGRSINAIRGHHIVLDSPSIKEEITSGEAFLSGISACGVTLVEGAARDSGIRLGRLEVTIEGFRTPNVPAFDRIAMRFAFEGPTRQEAEMLVGRYKDG